jgi:cytochrome b6-f complex iron-sulfur subunit
MNRRDFLGWVGVGWVASCLPIALAACTPKESAEAPANAPASTGDRRADGFEKVGMAASLNDSGSLFVKESALGAIVVTRNPDNPTEVAAVSPTCTHQGCVVPWKNDAKAFVCPCHGAKYSFDGKVLAAPATRPLKSFTAKIEGDAVLVKA